MITRELRHGAVVLFALGSCLLLGTVAHAYPGDVFANARPAQAPASADPMEMADEHVTGDGAASYTIPIVVPPGRQDLSPNLSLQYSSRAPARGGLAAGWSLPVPRIEVDTSSGRLGRAEYESSLTGTRLVRVTEPSASNVESFRAERDLTFARYERVKNADGSTLLWRVRTLGGQVMYFGEHDLARDVPHSASAPDAKEARWFLRRVVDRFGNEVVYTYDKHLTLVRDGSNFVPVDIYLKKIEWGANPAAGLTHSARIELEYADLDLCPGSFVPIGASFSWRTGFPLMEGARRVARLRTSVRSGSTWTERRRYELGYDMSELACSSGRTHAPLRLLTSVKESAVSPDGTQLSLPPMTFEYGRRELELTSRVQLTPKGSGYNALAPAKAGGWPSLDSMLLDFDGDGRLDLLASEPTADPTECGVTWTRNRGDGSFDPAIPLNLPTVPWKGSTRSDSTDRNQREGCSLSHQFSRVTTPGRTECGLPATYNSYRFMDVTGDGLPDLVTAIDTNRGRYLPEADGALWPAGSAPSCPPDAGACRDAAGNPTRCAVSSPVPPGPSIAFDNQQPPTSTCELGTSGCQHPSCQFETGDCPCNVFYCDLPFDAVLPNEYGPPIDNDCGALSAGTCSMPDGPPTGGPAFSGTLWAGEAWNSGDQGKEGRLPSLNNYACYQQPEERCGRFVWRVYRNDGAGFADEPEVMLSPTPLESDRGTSALGAGVLAASSSWHGFVDMDGDGQLDAVYMQPYWDHSGIEQGTPPVHFQVFRGDGAGHFRGDDAGNPFVWRTPVIGTGDGQRARVKLQTNTHGLPFFPNDDNVRASKTTVFLDDMNGDGLADYIDARFDGRVHVFYNTGKGFDVATGYRGSTLETAAWGSARYEGYDLSHQYVLQSYENNQLAGGWSRSVVRPVDIDVDGLMDLVVIRAPQRGQRNPWLSGISTGAVKLYINVGDKLVPMGSTPRLEEWWRALARITLEGGGIWLPHWRVATDFVDLDGDGLPEAFNNDSLVSACVPDPYDFQFPGTCGIGYESWTSPRDGQGMRLLRTVKNGRGGELRFDYAPAEPGEGRVPHPVWVVSSITSTAGPTAAGTPAPASVTTLDYRDPVYLQDDAGEWAFRGFAETSRTGPSGAHRVSRFDYAQHWGGLLTESRVYDAAGGRLHYLEKAGWERIELFDGAFSAWVSNTKEVHNCRANQTEAGCETGGDVGYTRTTWSPYRAGLVSFGPAYAYAISEVESGDAPTPTAGTQRANTSFILFNDATTYLMQPTTEQRWVADDAGSWQWAAKTSHVYDPSWRVEQKKKLYSTATTWAETRYAYDMLTGNATGVRKPEQAAADLWTSFIYDAERLFVTRTTNELFQSVDTTWDAATGTQLSQRGPNARAAVKEGWERSIDGLGRTLEERVYVDSVVRLPWGGTSVTYAPVAIARNSYNDYPDGHVGGFRRSTAQRRIELNEERWTKVDTDVDGADRVAVVTEYEGAAIASRTRRHYDAAGRLVRVDVPAPHGTGAVTVAYIYQHDPHGRPELVLGPDGADKDWSYDGRLTMREDVAGTAGGNVGTTRTRVDVFGRLVEVAELRDDDSWAVTTYAYDGNNNLRRIVDPDGVLTELEHDGRSLRTRIVQGARELRYEYDGNSRLTAIRAVADGNVALAHVTTIAYDHLDRETSRVAGARDLTSDQLNRYGSALVQRYYDENPTDNGVGRLSRIVQPWGTSSLRYEARGLPIERTTAVQVAGVLTDTRSEVTTYNAQGGPRTLSYADRLGTAPPTSMRFDRDGRGLALQTWWTNSNAAMATYTHTPAGGLATRHGPSHRHGVARNPSGRVTGIEVAVKAGGIETVVLDLDYLYNGVGEVETIHSRLGTAVDSFGFAYDRQHQLVSAAGAAGYAASFDFSPAGRVTAAALSADPSSGVQARDVTYDYLLDGDPTSPDALIASDGTTWLSLDHDAAGNTTSRTRAGGEPTLHVYDGFDLQREVIAPDGRREVYWYDGNRQRVGVATYQGSVLQQVRWHFGATEVEYGPGSAVTRTIAHVADEGSIARIENRTVAEYVFTDHYGHTALVTNSAGSILAGFAYGPFGEVLREIGSQASDIRRRFNGKEHDIASSLVYYGYRYYDPLSLTWTQSDPLYRVAPDLAFDEPRRMAGYTFSLNNALHYVDPDGLDNKEDQKVCESGEECVATLPVHVVVKQQSTATAGTVKNNGGKVLTPPVGKKEPNNAEMNAVFSSQLWKNFGMFSVPLVTVQHEIRGIWIQDGTFKDVPKSDPRISRLLGLGTFIDVQSDIRYEEGGNSLIVQHTFAEGSGKSSVTLTLGAVSVGTEIGGSSGEPSRQAVHRLVLTPATSQKAWRAAAVHAPDWADNSQQGYKEDSWEFRDEWPDRNGASIRR